MENQNNINQPDIQPQHTHTEKIVKQRHPGRVWLIIGIVLSVLSLFVIFGSDSEEPTSDTPTQSTTETADNGKTNNNTSSEMTIEYTPVTADKLINTLSDNALLAEDYTNSYLEITGNISNIDSDGEYFSIDGNDFSFYSIQLNITDKSQLDFLKTKSIDDEVTVKCKITSVGELLGYSGDCYEIY